jgi:AraC-like DNA-binding protein
VINPFQRHLRTPTVSSLTADLGDPPLPLASSHRDLQSSLNGQFVWRSPALSVVAQEGSAIATQLPARRWKSLLVVVSGAVRLHQCSSTLCGAAGDCLFIPEPPLEWQSTAYSVVCVMVSPAQLAAVIKILREREAERAVGQEWDFAQPVCRKAEDGELTAALLATVRHLLQVTGELASADPQLLTRLGISQQLSMLTALLACPLYESAAVEQPKAARVGSAVEAIEELMAFILQHLSEPLNLNLLEKQSNYSRRALQYAFRERMGCTITQWIRAQRLDLAYQKLTAARAHETVTSIAQACGYRSVSLFSIEFQNRFHIKPSVLLREHQR